MCVCVHVHAIVLCGDHKMTCGRQFSLSTMWGLGKQEPSPADSSLAQECKLSESGGSPDSKLFL